MARGARRKSKSGIYHIILRGQNRQAIFEDDEDKEKFLETLKEVKRKSRCKIYGYCLMGNHIHLLLQETDEPIEIIMRRIGASYVYWYNWKYRRCGHLFQDRYKSEAVEDDSYFLTVLRYIHQNPVKAGVVKKHSEYRWSSYGEYIGGSGITDISFALEMIGGDGGQTLSRFIKFHDEMCDAPCLEDEDIRRPNDKEAQEIIKHRCGVASGLDLKEAEPGKRDRWIKELKKEGLSTRQLERLTGISRTIILKA